MVLGIPPPTREGASSLKTLFFQAPLEGLLEQEIVPQATALTPSEAPIPGAPQLTVPEATSVCPSSPASGDLGGESLQEPLPSGPHPQQGPLWSWALLHHPSPLPTPTHRPDGKCLAVEGGREDLRLARGSEWGICYQRSPAPGILGLSSPPDLPLPTQTHTAATTPIPSVLRGKTLSFVYSLHSEEMSLLCISLGRVDPAWGPFFTGSQSTVREIPLPRREAAIDQGGRAQSPEEASPHPRPDSKSHPDPHTVGNGSEARRGTDRTPAPARPLPASSAAAGNQ